MSLFDDDDETVLDYDDDDGDADIASQHQNSLIREEVSPASSASISSSLQRRFAPTVTVYFSFHPISSKQKAHLMERELEQNMLDIIRRQDVLATVLSLRIQWNKSHGYISFTTELKCNQVLEMLCVCPIREGYAFNFRKYESRPSNDQSLNHRSQAGSKWMSPPRSSASNVGRRHRSRSLDVAIDHLSNKDADALFSLVDSTNRLVHTLTTHARNKLGYRERHTPYRR